VQSDLSDTVDTDKVALWGTSFAGGHVLVVASEPQFQDQISAVVTQVSERSCMPCLEIVQFYKGPCAVDSVMSCQSQG
jgi:hypothetical protein